MAPDEVYWGLSDEHTVDHEDDYDSQGHFEGYEPLEQLKKQIRVLKILPRGVGLIPDLENLDLVYCRVVTASLEDEDLVFNALSYVWGRKEDAECIVVNDQLVFIGKNLESALRHLRDYHMEAMRGLPLWVDAICINQNDHDERVGQVEMMGEIYRRAHRVFPWLGEGDPDTDWLIPMLRRDNKTQWTRVFAKRDDLIFRSVATIIKDISRRAWWSRFWIIQELLLAQQDPILVVGQESITWSDYSVIFRHFYDIHLKWPEYYPSYQAAVDALYVSTYPETPFLRGGTELAGRAMTMFNNLRMDIQKDGHAPLSRLLSIGNLHLFHTAARPADYVYGIRGLLPVEEQRLIKVDYETKSPMQVFHEAMIVVWTSPLSTDRLHMIPLRLKFQRDRENDGIPSWVPDLSQQVGLWKKATADGGASLTPWKTVSVSVSSDNRTLTLRGIYFDAVSEVRHVVIERQAVDRAQFWIPDLAALKETVQWTLAALHRDTNHKLGGFRNRGDATLLAMRTLVDLPSIPTEFLPSVFESGPDGFWRMFWDHFLNLEPSDARSLIVSLAQFVRPEVARYKSEELVTPKKAKAVKSGRFSPGYCVDKLTNAIRTRLRGHAVFQTEVGFVGVGPGHMEAGDSIVFPFGMSCPFIVRPVNSDCPTNHVYTMIGIAEVPELIDHRERLDDFFDHGLFEEVDIHLI